MKEARDIKQPVSKIEWVKRDSIRPNDYNPNAVPPPELKLLKLSILEDGWTQPIVVGHDGVIIDGEHRWQIAGDEDIAKLTSGLVPIVRIKKGRAERILATIRHNRARGEHIIIPMAAIVRELLTLMDKSEVMERLQAEDEEIERLAERASLPDVIARKRPELSKGWLPG